MNDQTVNEPPTGYLEIIARRKWWVVVATVLAVAAALGVSTFQVKRYTATAQVQAQNAIVTSSVNQSQPTPTLGAAQLATYVQLATSPSVTDAVRKLLNVPGKVPQVSVSAVGTTDLIAISATSTHASEAAQIANDYADAFAAYELGIARTRAKSLVTSYTKAYTHLSRQAQSVKNSSEQIAIAAQEALIAEDLGFAQSAFLNPSSAISVVSPAVIPTSPSSPKPVRDGLTGLFAGILVGLGLAIALDYFDDRLRSAADVRRILHDIPILAAVPLIDSWKNRQDPVLVSVTNPTSPEVESYWSLRTSLKFLAQERQLGSVVITSPVEGEGKTATIANLGVVLARGGQRTVLVSCDLRRPRLATFFNDDSPDPGLLSVLLDEVALGDAVQQVQGIPNLWILDTGPLPPDPHQALADLAAQKIFEELALNFEVVLIDSPPLLPVADALVLGQIADATLMIMSVRQTRKRQLRRALEMLETAHIPLVGVIVNEVSHSSSRYPSYDYGYGGYSYKPPERKKAAHKKEHRGNLVLPSVSGADENEASPVDAEETSQIGEEPRTWRAVRGSAEASG